MVHDSAISSERKTNAKACQNIQTNEATNEHIVNFWDKRVMISTIKEKKDTTKILLLSTRCTQHDTAWGEIHQHSTFL